LLVPFCEIRRLEDFPIEIKIRRRTKCQSKQQNIIRKPSNITSTQLAIIRKQQNIMRPAITRKPRTMLMLHTMTISRHFSTTRSQQKSISTITATSRTCVTEKATVEIAPQYNNFDREKLAASTRTA